MNKSFIKHIYYHSFSVDYNCKKKDNGDSEGEFDFGPTEGYYRGTGIYSLT